MSIDEHNDMQSAPAVPAKETAPLVAVEAEQINTPVVEGKERKRTLLENPWDEDIEDIEVPDEEVPDEEVPDESDEPITPNYNIENTPSNGNAYVAAGDQAQLHQHTTTYHNVTNRYDHLQIIMESQQLFPEKLEENFHNIHDLVKQALVLARQSSVIPPPKSRPEAAPLPTTHDAISNWFYDLDEYEQCYAQAAALLHGTTASDVSKYADEFYLLHRVQQNTAASSSSETLSEELRTSLLSLHNRSKRDLQTKTFTITQRVDGVEQLYWQDVQVDGSSSFHLKFLDFLAGEYLSKGLHGQEVLKQVGIWAQRSDARLFQCIARALGVFLWHQDRKALIRKAKDWASVSSPTSWQRTAILLDAAYEIDVITYPEHKNSRNTSLVLNILSEWVEQTQKMESKASVYRGCTAANTYALIGKRQLEVALSGLAQLLLISAEKPVEIDKLQAAIVSAYFTLSWSGHVHQVLCHLCSMTEQSLLQQIQQQTARLRRRDHLQRLLRLQVGLDAFFFIALDSSSSASIQSASTYQEPLSTSPSLQERQQRDIILGGILATDNAPKLTWRKEVMKLLSAALIEKSSQASAFDLLACWATALLHMEDVSSPQGDLLIASFQAFLGDLGQMLDTWCIDLKQQNRPSPALLIYKHRLTLWSNRKNPFGKLFRQVVYQANTL